MSTFEISGTRPGDKQLMTGQTRESAVEAVLCLLRKLELKGLEQITVEHITKLTANPDANNPEYRSISSSLHHAAFLFRFCVRKSLLPNNPLVNIDNSSFANYAVRDFLPPDQLDILLDMQRIQTKTETTVIQHTPDWVSEDDGKLILEQRWQHLPIERALREFMEEKKALQHMGKHWAVYYDAAFLKWLVEQYEPLADHNIDIRDRALQPLLARYKLESIGYLKLIKKADLVALLKEIGSRGRILACEPTRKGYMQKLAKVKIEKTAQELDYAVNA